MSHKGEPARWEEHATGPFFIMYSIQSDLQEMKEGGEGC
jgi:hypothetical protein